MTLADARVAILSSLARVNAAYGQPLFNEWVLVALRADRGSILAYDGPRAESYQKQFRLDMASMMKELASQKLGIGDFVFAAEAHGSHYDSCMRIGATSYLFCNHTQRTMTELRQSPLWLNAQKHWVKLSQVVSADPLE
ncbi:MAG: hypothetical protein Q8M02_06140 [Candidatus Didemnitutus sp.]|nr:hypothetical protein [Candidatus Didemnitutus sp.]